jgi:hypothetical protein
MPLDGICLERIATNEDPTMSEESPPAFEWDTKSAVRFPRDLSTARAPHLFAG